MNTKIQKILLLMVFLSISFFMISDTAQALLCDCQNCGSTCVGDEMCGMLCCEGVEPNPTPPPDTRCDGSYTFSSYTNCSPDCACMSCGSDSCDGWSSWSVSCDGIWHEGSRSRTCHDRGCSEGSCYDNTYTDPDSFSEDCSYDQWVAGWPYIPYSCCSPFGHPGEICSCENWDHRMGKCVPGCQTYVSETAITSSGCVNHCTNGVKDCDEKYVDCGGAHCPACICNSDTDCDVHNDEDGCTDNVCSVPGTDSCVFPLCCLGADTECGCGCPSQAIECGCTVSCENCNNQDGWYSDGTANYSCCCDASGNCDTVGHNGKDNHSDCQEQEYRNYYCSDYSCDYNIENDPITSQSHRTFHTLVTNCDTCGGVDGSGDDWYDVVTGNDGIIQDAGYTSDTPDGSDFALEFDGTYDSYVEMPDSKSLNIQDEISIEAWVKSETQILPPWYNTSWDYRKAVDITGSSVTVTDYQVLLTINTQELISQGKMKDDCSDIRVTKSDTITEIPFYTASECNTDSTSVWAKIPSIPSTGTTVYVYYGNPGAVSASDKGAVFQLFDGFEQEGGVVLSDGFEDGDIGDWTTGGHANWSAVNSQANTGSWSAKSGDIGDSQVTYIARDIVGPATINFNWKVSSNKTYLSKWYIDYLKFYVDGAEIWAIAGEVDWVNKSYSIPAGEHTIGWVYVKDDAFTSGSDSGWIDDITVTEGGLGDGGWTTGGDVSWNAVNNEANTGFWSAKSGNIGDNQNTYITRDIVGPATINFHWKVSSNKTYLSKWYIDYLKFYVDGVEIWAIAGEVDWVNKSYSIPAGNHTIGWVYVKDEAYAGGQDSGWIDDVMTRKSVSPEPVSGTPGSEVKRVKARRILSKGDGYLLKINFDGTQAYGEINGNWVTASVPSPALNAWHHYVLTYNKSKQILYIDGGKVAEADFSQAINTNTNNLMIGETFSGKIDEARLYKRALSPAEVQGHFAGTFNDETDLMGLWHMDEGVGSTVVDTISQTCAGECDCSFFREEYRDYYCTPDCAYEITDYETTSEPCSICSSDADCDDTDICTADVCPLPLGTLPCEYPNHCTLGDETNCGCEADDCKDCSDTYGQACGYDGSPAFCACAADETPTWSCNGTACECVCAFDVACAAVCSDDADCDDLNDCTDNVCPLPLGTLPCEYPSYCALGDETNCGCEAADCKDCSDTYGQACGYDGSPAFCACAADETPTWSCNETDCECICAFDVACAGNTAPVAALSCNPAMCAGYISDIPSFNNDSTDVDSTNPPDMNNDIERSSWYVDGVFDTQYTGTNTMNSFPPSLTVGSHAIMLEVRDGDGLSKIDTETFTVKQDAIASFMCSVDEVNWQNCASFAPRILEGQWIYFKDVSTVSENASNVIFWTWEEYVLSTTSWEVFDGSEAFAELRFTGNTDIRLTIIDDAWRSDTKTDTIGVKVMSKIRFEETRPPTIDPY